MHDHFPFKVNSLTTFSVENFGVKNWSERWLGYIKKTIKEGALGVKVWKNIGMVLRNTDSSFVMIDDTSFEKIFMYLEDNDIPLLAHIGEPLNCWLPLDKMTMNGEKKYFSNHPQYYMYLHPEYPSYSDQIVSRDNLLKKYSNLKIIGAHLGSLEWNIDSLSKRFELYPNFAVDMSGRIQHLQYQSLTDYNQVRDFIIKYQDRFIYGTDLAARKEEDINDAMGYAHKIWYNNWQYFVTDDSMTSEQFKGKFKALKLPKSVIDKIYYYNAVKWYKYPIKEKEIKKNDNYTNPVGDYVRMGDPYVLKFEDQYYLYGTVGRDGFKCWSSKNLRDWVYEGYAFKENKESFGESTYWAPEVINYKGKFYMTYSCRAKKPPYDKQMLVCLAESNSPTGPFIDKYTPLIDKGFSCIDADVFVDDDGTPFIYFDRVGTVGEWPKKYMFGIIYGMKLDKQTLLPVGDTVRIIEASQEWENPQSCFSRCNEGAFVFKNNNKYYITYSANHYADPNYGIGYATADSPLGNWAKSPDNPLICKDTVKGIYGPGHNSITTSLDGKDMFIVYHTHVSKEDKNRTVNIDRLEINEKGQLEIIGPTRTPQSLP